jgi:LmbE family N-acetylglucosaminyl deacetylase
MDKRVSRDKKILFICAHQDDEVFVRSRISLALRGGVAPYFVYLTNGTVKGSSAIRDHESRRFLGQLGVAAKQIFFLGTEFRIPDGELVSHLQTCFALLLEHVKEHVFTEIYAPAWEGGHQDHDAAFLLGLALARHLRLENNFWQFYLYNGFNTRGRFFRVVYPLPCNLQRIERKLAFSEGLAALKSILVFKSQRKTWLGLFPQLLIQLLFIRREIFHRGSLQQIAAPAHEGGLLYERWKRMAYTDFKKKALQFEIDYLGASKF